MMHHAPLTILNYEMNASVELLLTYVHHVNVIRTALLYNVLDMGKLLPGLSDPRRACDTRSNVSSKIQSHTR